MEDIRTGRATQKRPYTWNYDCSPYYGTLTQSAQQLGINARVIGSSLLEVSGPQGARKLHIPEALSAPTSFDAASSGRAGYELLSRIFVSIAQMASKAEDFERLGIGSHAPFATWWIREIGPFYTKISHQIGPSAHNALLRAAAAGIGVEIAVDLDDGLDNPGLENGESASTPEPDNVIPISRARSMHGR